MKDRYGITLEERERVIANYFKEDQTKPLEVFPRKEKRKIIVLQYIAERFAPHQTYSEKEVNSIIKSFHHDYASVRRYLIDYGFMERSKDNAFYWLID